MSEEQRRRLTLAATALGSALAFIDASVVVVALPTIQHDLDFGLAGEQWVFLAYSLALAALYLPAGAIGDRHGRRGPGSSSPTPAAAANARASVSAGSTSRAPCSPRPRSERPPTGSSMARRTALPASGGHSSSRRSRWAHSSSSNSTSPSRCSPS